MDSDGPDDDTSSTSSHTDNAHTERQDEVVIPPWDAKLSDDQITAWRAAELKVGTKRSIKGWLAAKKRHAATTTGTAVRAVGGY